MLVVDFSFTEAPPPVTQPLVAISCTSAHVPAARGWVLSYNTAMEHGCVHVKFHKEWDMLDTRWGYVCLHFMPVTNPLERLNNS